MGNMNIRYKSIVELRHLLDEGAMSIEDLTKETIKHIKADNSNAVLHCSEELALEQARQLAESAEKAQVKTLLSGIPIIYKDNFNVKGTPTTCASKMLENYHSPYDATVVDLMQQQGAISIAKANMDEFAMGSTNENSAFGHVANPFNAEHCTGGSSGGSAAVVANGLVPVAFGSDTGGSVRQPAAFCGVHGLKPTYGRLSRFGVVAFGSSFDQPGIFARHPEDIAITLTATAHHDPKDSTSVARAGEDYLSQINLSLAGKKVGVVKSLFERVENPEMRKRYEEALQVYRDLGIELVDVELPDPELCVAAYYVLSSSECSTNLSRFDGVRYGHRASDIEDLESLYRKSRTEGFGAEVKRRILLGTFALSAGYFDAYYVKAQKMRRAILNQFQETFTQVDSILLPTSLTTAPKLGQDFDYNDDMCTITANLAGLPAISLPVGLADGLPVGLQVIGKAFSEGDLLNMCSNFALETHYAHLIKAD